MEMCADDTAYNWPMHDAINMQKRKNSSQYKNWNLLIHRAIL